MAFRGALLEMTKLANGAYSCGSTTVYLDPPPKADYQVHAGRDHESLNSGPALPGDKPFSVGPVTTQGGARIATLKFNTSSPNIEAWHRDHFDKGRVVKVWMDLTFPHADEPLLILLRCKTDAASIPMMLMKKFIDFCIVVGSKIKRSLGLGKVETRFEPPKQAAPIDDAAARETAAPDSETGARRDSPEKKRGAA